MSATMENSSSPLDDYLVMGETVFVSGAILAFISEVALTFRSLVLPDWIGLGLGLVFIGVTLYMINWLYSGAREARTPAMAWAGLQIAIALVGSLLLLNNMFRLDYRFFGLGEVLPRTLSVATPWLGLFKAAAYGLFLYLITQRGPALFFLRHKGGEAVDVPSPTTPPEDVRPTGVVLALAPDQVAKADALAARLQSAGIALMITGFLEAVVGGQRIAATPRQGWLILGEGVVFLIMGLIALGPVTSIRNIRDRGADTAYVVDALAKLLALFQKQLLLTVALAALGITALVIRL